MGKRTAAGKTGHADGICIYNIGAAVLLGMCGTIGEMSGVILWPGVGLHGLIGATMLWVILGLSRKSVD